MAITTGGAAETRQKQPVDGIFAARVAFWVSVVGAALTALVAVRRAIDIFAAPKEYALRASGLVVLAVLLLWATFSTRTLIAETARHRAALLVVAMAITWTAVATFFSQEPLLSCWTLLRVVLCGALAVAVVLGARFEPIEVLYAVLTPAIINTALLIVQVHLKWDVIYPPRMRPVRSALLGNSNWVGAYLLIAALIAVAFVLAAPRLRLLNAAIAALLVWGVIESQSAASIGALVVGAAAMAAVISWRRALVAWIVIAAVVVGVVSQYGPARDRFEVFRHAAAVGDLNRLASSRLTAYVAAWDMFRDHPLTGVGPGCYARQYFQYKIRAEARHPILRLSDDRKVFFGEAHNDHLELLATTGLPGYLVFLTALAFVGLRTIRGPRGSDPRMWFARLLSLPLAAALAVLMVAQFPLALAASTYFVVLTAALCVGWSTNA